MRSLCWFLLLHHVFDVFVFCLMQAILKMASHIKDWDFVQAVMFEVWLHLFDSTDRSKFSIARYHKAGGAARFWVCLMCSYAEKWYFAMARCQFEPCFWWENGPAQDDRAAKYTPKPGTVSQFQSLAAALLQIDSSDWEWKRKLLHQLGRRSESILQISCISVSVDLLNRRESKRECGIMRYQWLQMEMIQKLIV